MPAALITQMNEINIKIIQDNEEALVRHIDHGPDSKAVKFDTARIVRRFFSLKHFNVFILIFLFIGLYYIQIFKNV